MKKTFNINLSGLVFTIDEDAYAVLKQYLDDIATYFDKELGKEEIIADIESRFAEEFSQNKSAVKQVISLEDVDTIIATMGRVEDFSSEEPKTKTQTESPREGGTAEGPRRLYRDTDNAILGGVSSGIANYFSVDPVFIRILFVVFTFAGGFAIPLYIILWIVTPKAETPLQKAEMKGEALTLKDIEEQVKKVFDEGKKKFEDLNEKSFGKRLNGFGREVGMRIQLVFGKIFGVIGSVLGFLFSLGSFVGIVGLGVAAGVAIVHRHSPQLGIEIQNYLPLPEYFLSVIFFTGILLFPLLSILLLGIRLMSKRPTFSATVVAILIGFWTLCLIGGGIMVSKIIPAVKQLQQETQSRQNDQKTIHYDLTDFDTLQIHGKNRVHITQGEKYMVQVTAKEWKLKKLEVEKTGTSLKISSRDHFSFCFFCTQGQTDIEITLPQLKKLEVSGEVEVVSDSLNTEVLTMDISGASNFTGNIDVQDLLLNIDGVGTVKLTGKAKRATLEMNGASRLNGYDLSVDAVHVDMSGVSKATLTANHNIEGEISGAAEMKYRGGYPLVNMLKVWAGGAVYNESVPSNSSSQ